MNSDDIQIVEYYLNNSDLYPLSKPAPRCDTYGRDGWYYMNNPPIAPDTMADMICNINIYNENSAKSYDNQDISNFLQVNNIESLSMKLIINGLETTNDSSETIQSYYPYITIGTVPTGVNDLTVDYHSKINLYISPNGTSPVPSAQSLIYFYKDANGICYYKNKSRDTNGIFNNSFKNVEILQDINNTTDINIEVIKDIWINSPSKLDAYSVSFLLQEVELKTINMLSQNFTRKILFKKNVADSPTNKNELVLHDGPLFGLTAINITTLGFRHCIIMVNITATSGSPSKDVFLSYSSDNLNYYTDSKNIICQEFGIAGHYTGVVRLDNVGFQFIKVFANDPQITNVKIAYSVFN